MVSRFIDFYEMFAGLHIFFFVTLLTILIPKKERKV